MCVCVGGVCYKYIVCVGVGGGVVSCLFVPVMCWWDENPNNRKHQRVKALTFFVTIGVAGALILEDWDSTTKGQPNVFSNLKPALKGFLNRLYGVEGDQAGGSGGKVQD